MSLFPFLDTLVCTMGALILMLLAMTPKIKERAQARLQAQMDATASTETADPDPEPESVPVFAPEPDPEPAAQPVVVAAIPNRAQIEEEHAAERKRRREAWFKSAAEARDSLAAKQADYRKRRQLLKETDQRLKDLQDQILKSQLQAESVDKADQSLAKAADRLEAQQERVAQEIAQTRKSIDVLDRRQAAAKNEYSLVPYDGTSGTVRRPVYIECTVKGFRFLPEDETVSPADLEGFTDGYNPLLTGTQSLVRFWARRRRSSPESEPEPYVLLLVRPSGCFNYYVARKFLSLLNVPFGYELIEEDWKLSVPDADPIAKSLLKETLDTTVQSGRPARNSFADADRGDGFGDSREFTRGDRVNHFGSSDDDDNQGGFGSGNGSGRGTGRKPSVKFGPATRAGRAAGGGGDEDDPLADNDGSPGTGKGAVTGASGRTTAGGGGSGRGARAARAAGMSSGSRNGAGAGAGNSEGDGDIDSSRTGVASRGSPGGLSGRSGTPGFSDTPGGDSLGGDSSGGDSIGDFGTLSPGGQTGANGGKGGMGSTGSTGTDRGLGGGSNDTGSLFGGTGRGGRMGRAGSARPASLSGNSSEFGGNGGSGNGGSGNGSSGDDDDPLALPPDSSDRMLGGDGPAGTARTGSDPTLTPSSSNSKNATGGQSAFDFADSGPASGDGSSTRGSRSGSPGGSQSGSSALSRSSSSNSSASGSSGSSGSSQGDSANGSSSAGGSSPSSVQMGGPGATVSLGGNKMSKQRPKDDDPDDGPRISEEDARKGGQSGRSRGPRKWGQVGNKASIGFVQKIEIRLMADRILVGSKDLVIPVRPADSDDEIVHRVVNAIDHVCDKLGQPPPGYYWVPAAKFVVYPGGDAYSEKLSKTLEHTYGVDSTVDFADDKPVSKPAQKTAPKGRP
jgi:hypothetical protein